MRFPNKVADRMCRPRVCVFVCARRTVLLAKSKRMKKLTALTEWEKLYSATRNINIDAHTQSACYNILQEAKNEPPTKTENPMKKKPNTDRSTKRTKGNMPNTDEAHERTYG